METTTRTQTATIRTTTVTRFKKFAITMLAAATVAFGGLAAQPTASAKPMNCSEAVDQAREYFVIAGLLVLLGDYARANYYFGRAQGLTEAAC